jgi:transposase
MSLPVFDPQTHLFGLAAVSSEVFGDSDRYRLFAEKIYPLLVQSRPALEQCYCEDNGRPGVEPVLVMGVSVLQFLERAPDRQAVEMVKYHMGWKFGLNQELNSEEFHPTVLVRFRERLIAHEQGRLAFDMVLGGLQEAGLVPKRGKQRLDSTHVLGLVSRMSSLECVRETLRLALEELEKGVAEEQRPECWGLVWERYVESRLDYKTPEEGLRAKMRQAGEDIVQLQGWVGKLGQGVQQGVQVQLLNRVFQERFQVGDSGQVDVIEITSTGAVHNPHDPEAEWSAKGHGKRKKDWVGYKLQVAETVGDRRRENGEPTEQFITVVVTQLATQSEEAGMERVFQEQSQMGLDKPSELYVDAAYVSAQELAEARAEGWELVGPAQPSSSRKKGFRTEAFQVDVEQRRAVCPAGRQSTQCSRLAEERTGKVSYRFEWSWQCRDCRLREPCLGPGQSQRTLVVGEHHTVLQARRREMKTEAFQQRMKQRNSIEGTHSELVRAHGARRARYRGLKKVTLQNYFIGAACNVKRWIHRMSWEIQRAAAGVECIAQTS